MDDVVWNVLWNIFYVRCSHRLVKGVSVTMATVATCAFVPNYTVITVLM